MQILYFAVLKIYDNQLINIFYCKLNTSDTTLDPFNNLYSYPTHTAFAVRALATVKISFISDDILFIKNMLTKTYKISKKFNTLVFVLEFVLIIIAGVYWWKKNISRHGLSASEDLWVIFLH